MIAFEENKANKESVPDPKADWRSWLSYPGHISREHAETLDALVRAIPAPPEEKTGGDRYVAIADFLRECERQGYINESDHRRLRDEIGPQM